MTAALETSRLGSLARLRQLADQQDVNQGQYDPNATPPASSGTWQNISNSFGNALTNLGGMYGLNSLLGSSSTAAPAGTTTSSVLGASYGPALNTAGAPAIANYGATAGAEAAANGGTFGYGAAEAGGASGLGAVPYAAVPLGAMALYNDFQLLRKDLGSGDKGKEGKAVDIGTSYIDVVFPGIGTAIRTGLNALGVGTGGGNPREASRNAWRRALEEKLGVKDFGGREELDPGKNPLDAEAIALADPIAEMLAGNDAKGREDAADVIARQLTMGARTNEDMRNNLLNIVNKLDLTPQQVRSSLNQGYRSGNITRDRAMAYANNMAALTGRSPEQEFNYIVGTRNGNQR